MTTTVNAKEQGWADGIHWLLIVRHFYAGDELIGKFNSRSAAEDAANELDEVPLAMSLILNPDGSF
jgi:hypothetical protein